MLHTVQRKRERFLKKSAISLDPFPCQVFCELFLFAVHTSSMDLGFEIEVMEVWFCIQLTISVLCYPNSWDYCPVKRDIDDPRFYGGGYRDFHLQTVYFQRVHDAIHS